MRVAIVGFASTRSMDVEDTTDSSQETFEMTGSGRKKKLTGKLHEEKCDCSNSVLRNYCMCVEFLHDIQFLK